MPCYVIVQIEVKDEAAARDALKAMSLDPDLHLTKVGGRFYVQGIMPSQEDRFRQQYGKAFSVREARRKYFTFSQEETLPDGSIQLKFSRS